MGVEHNRKVRSSHFSPNFKYQTRLKKERCRLRRLGAKVALWVSSPLGRASDSESSFFQHQKKSLYTDESSL